MLRESDLFDAQGFSFAEFGEQKAPALVTVQHGAHGATATIADAHLLFNSDFTRSGNDLYLNGHNGDRAIVRDYFGAGESAALMSREGARLSPDLVEALTRSVAPQQYAQAAPPAPAASDAVGRVVTASPDSTILRNGVPVTVAAGDPVLRADVLQTAGGTMAVTFNDGSTLNLTANTRIVVSEFIYSPSNTGNSQLLDLVQGSLTFISGEIAHTGDMRIGTPVATMGIRGTVGGVTTASDGTVQFYVSQSATGAVIINQQGQIIANVVQDGPMIVVRPIGPIEVIADEVQKTPAQLAIELQALQQIVNIKAVGDQLLQQFFQQQQQQDPNPQAPQNGPHTQIPVNDQVKITLLLDDNAGGGGGATPVTHAVIENLTKDPDAPPVITVPIPVNLPPVTFAPLSLTTAEDTPLVFNGPKAISIIDNDSSTLTVTLSVTNGVLALGSVAGLSFSAGGTGQAAMTFSGSPAAIAAALNGLTYTPSQDYNGAAVLSITKTDGASAPTTTTVALNVTPVNDAPVIVGSMAVDLPQIEGAGPGGNLEPDAALQAQIDASPGVQDALSGLLTVPAGVITVALATVRDELNVDTATAMVVVWDYLDDIYVSAGPYQANVNEAFTRLGIEYAKYLKDGGAPLTNITAKYTPDGNSNGTPDREQSLHDNLLGNLGLAALNQRYGGDPALLAELRALIEAIDPELLNRPYYSGNETASPAAVQAWDQANGYAPAVFTENGGPAVINARLTLSDVDSATLAGATVKIAGNFASGEDVLDFTAQGGITGTYDAATGVLTLSGTASLADYQAVLRSVTYQNTSDNPSGDARTIEFQVNDGSSQHAASNVVAVTVNVTPVNDAPVIVGSVAVDLPQIEGAGPGGNLEPDAALQAQIDASPAVQDALSGLLTVPAGVITVALATVRDELNVDTATAMVVVWDYLDDIYVSAGPYQANVNEAFTRLGIEYAKYLKDGGAPLTNITAKYTPDGNSNGTPDREQSLHDNLLGNLGLAALQQRYGISNPALQAELTALIEAIDPQLLTRPYYSGNETASPAAVQAWDHDNGYTPAATGMLVATDADHNATLTWSVSAAAGIYGIFALDAVSGVWTYKLDYSLPATQALAQGETVTETFTATVTDEHGATDTIDVTVTVGTSDDNTLNLSAADWAASTAIDLGGGTNIINVLASGDDISAAGVPLVAHVDAGNLVGTCGDDSITLTGLQLDHIIAGSGTIDLGAGCNDTINLTSTSADLNTLGATDGAITGVEIVSAAGAVEAVTIDLHGQSEAFTIIGSAYADTLIGGMGDDTLTGGSGADTFVFHANFGNDTITDFTAGVDFLWFDQALFVDAAAVLAATTDVNGHAVIAYDSNNTITLNIDEATLASHSGHILFA